MSERTKPRCKMEDGNLSRRDFILGGTMLGLTALGLHLLKSPGEAVAGGKDISEEGYPEGYEDLYQAWENLANDYQYKTDEKGKETWQLGNEGDCEDFLLELFYGGNLGARYNASLIRARYSEGLSFKDLEYKDRSGGHYLMFLKDRNNELENGSFVVDNGAWAGIVGPLGTSAGFEEVGESLTSAIIETQEVVDRYPFGFSKKREIEKIEIKSLPRVLPEGGLEELRLERGWQDIYTSARKE